MNKKIEKLKRKILKNYQKYLDFKNNPYTLSPKTFLWFPGIALLLLMVTGLALNFWLSFGTMLVVGALTFLGMSEYSTAANEKRLDKLTFKLFHLEYDYFEMLGCNVRRNILAVPEDKIESYLNGGYVLPTYYVVRENIEGYLLSYEEIEDLRSKGYEFYKNYNVLEYLTPEEVREIKGKGYTETRDDEVAVSYSKNGKKLFDEGPISEVIYRRHERNYVEEQEAKSLIKRMLETREISTEGSQDGEDVDTKTDTSYSNNDDLLV